MSVGPSQNLALLWGIRKSGTRQVQCMYLVKSSSLFPVLFSLQTAPNRPESLELKSPTSSQKHKLSYLYIYLEKLWVVATEQGLCSRTLVGDIKLATT